MPTYPETRVPHPPGGLLRGMARVVSRLTAWGLGRARAVYAVLGLWLALAFLAAALAIWGFAELAEEVMQGSTRRFDLAVMTWMNARASPGLTRLALSLTQLGSWTVVAVTGLVVSAFLWIHGERRAVALLWVALVGVTFLSALLKDLFGRERPAVFEWRTPYAGGRSFPSGHSMNAMVAYTVFAFLIARLASSPALRRATFLVAAALITLVGLSRIYLGVHYPSDVIAGFATGFAWAMACVFAVYVLRDLRGRG